MVNYRHYPTAYLHYGLFASSYISQHIGFGFINITLIVLLREQGVGLDQLSYLELIILPYSLRFLWSPLVDSLGWFKGQHFRNWLIPVQVLMLIFWVGFSFITPNQDFFLLCLGLSCFALLCGTQDLALDGLACSAFMPPQRDTINSIQIASGMLGNLIGGMLVMVYPDLGWQRCLQYLALLSLLPCLFLIFFKEPVAHKKSSPSVKVSFKEMIYFWKGKQLWFATLLLYAFALSGGFVIISPALVDAKWSFVDIGLIKNYGAIVGLLVVLGIIPLSRRFSLSIRIVTFSLLQILSLTLLLPLTFGNDSVFWIYLAMTACYLSFAPMFTTNSSIMMQFASQTHSPTTSYTIQIAIAMLFSILANMFYLQIAERWGYTSVIIIAIAASLFALYFIFKQLPQLNKES